VADQLLPMDFSALAGTIQPRNRGKGSTAQSDKRNWLQLLVANAWIYNHVGEIGNNIAQDNAYG
jgi:hypothetical protein